MRLLHTTHICYSEHSLKCKFIHNVPSQVKIISSTYKCTVVDTFQRVTFYPIRSFDTRKSVSSLESSSDTTVGANQGINTMKHFYIRTFLLWAHTNIYTQVSIFLINVRLLHSTHICYSQKVSMEMEINIITKYVHIHFVFDRKIKSLSLDFSWL